MHIKTEELINEYIDDIDDADYAKVFFAAIREAYGYASSKIVFDLYDALISIDITDNDIKNSKSNDLELCKQFENIWTSIKTSGVLEVIAAWEFIDNNTYYSALCLYKLDDKLMFKYTDDSIKDTVSLTTIDNLREMYIDRFNIDIWF